MTFLLSTQNVVEYLVEQGLCNREDRDLSQVKHKPAKNFNLLVTLPEGRKLLVKQERYTPAGKTLGEFWGEWRIQEFLQRFPEVDNLRSWLPEILHFDADNSILVFNYLDNYRDLLDFYLKEKIFPTAIATAIGVSLGELHRLTLERQEYQNYFSDNCEEVNQGYKYMVLDLPQRLERIGPEVFSQFSLDGLKFFKLYQRYDILGEAIAELGNTFEPCCLTHNDLKLNNILMFLDWEQTVSQRSRSDSSIVRLIDWERSSWGDPAYDLGRIIASYLTLWLTSLVSNKGLKIEESLRLAEIPLEAIQPSLAALVSAYFTQFPEILERRPDFLQRVMQFVGLNLIKFIYARLQDREYFGNTSICMLQVAKTLLCRPETSIFTVFGKEGLEIKSVKS